MKYYFQLQFLRLNRLLKEVGINPLLAYFLLLVIFIIGSQIVVNTINYGDWIYVGIAAFLFSKVQNSELLSLIFPNRVLRMLRIYEAVIFSAPFVLFLLLNQYYNQGLILLSFITTFSLLDIRTGFSLTLPTPFFQRPFEFIVGFRKTWFLLLLFYGLCVKAMQVENYNLCIFSIIIINLTLLGYYTKPESDFFVWVHKMSPTKFLINKAITVTAFSSLLILPIIIAMYLVFPSNWLITACIFLTCYFLPLTGMLNKYAFFPNDSELINGILIGLCIFFPPMLLIIIPYLANKATQNLKDYL